MSKDIRAFIAVELNRQIQSTIEQAQIFFKGFNFNVKWVKPYNTHLTLKFLGNVEIDKVGSITRVIQDSCSGYGSINIELANFGTFPTGKRPKIIWVGTTDPENKIKSLSSIIDNNLCALGFEKENRKIQPHITIGRIRSDKEGSSLSKKLGDYKIEKQQKQVIKSIALFKSTLNPDGPVYDKIISISLL